MPSGESQVGRGAGNGPIAFALPPAPGQASAPATAQSFEPA